MNSHKDYDFFTRFRKINIGILVKTLPFILLILFPLAGNAQLSWKVFGSLKTPRWRFETQVLPDNKILVIGGHIQNNTTTNSCEIIDTENENVIQVAPMKYKRTDFASVLVADSEVYVIGGFDSDKIVNSIEKYSIKNNKWTTIGVLQKPRRQHIAILLNDNEILIVGGRDSSLNTLNSVEIFDIVKGKSRLTTSFPSPVNCAMIQRTSKNDIVVFGGRAGGHNSSQSLMVMKFNTLDEKWVCIDTIPNGTAYPITTKLWNGSIVYSGGKDEKAGNSWLADVVIEKENKFRRIGLMQEGRHTHWIAQLDERRVITGSGLKANSAKSTTTTDIIDIETNEVIKGPEMIFPRREARAISIPIKKNGKIVKSRILVISGVDDKFLSSIEVLDDTPTISGVINCYTLVISLGKQPTSQIHVKDIKGFAIDDKVLIVQMQEKQSIKTQFNKTVPYTFAGNHEFGRIVSINGNTIALERQLTHQYSSSGKVQLVRVPEYSNVAIIGELTCKSWDGETGGILAFDVKGSLTMQAHINVSGKGFKGSTTESESSSSVFYQDSRSVSSSSYGEGIELIGNATTSSYQYSNGGESGAINNMGGAGGANVSCGGDGSIGWTSELSVNEFIPSKGGRALYNNNKKVFMGGGGGAGHADDGDTGYGGNGGGIVFVSCNNFICNGYSINANGTHGKESSFDGSGGGGAGGTVYLDIENLNYPLVINSLGGNGGNSVITNPDLPPAGSGGGGGGGLLLLKKHHSNIISHLDGGRHGVAGLVFSEYKAQNGCEGVLLDNVQIVDASIDQPDKKSFIDDCLTEDCTENKSERLPVHEIHEMTVNTNEETERFEGYVYPNPASDNVTIYGIESVEFTIFDSIGSIHSLPFTRNTNSITIDVSVLRNSIYFVKTGMYTISFIVSK